MELDVIADRAIVRMIVRTITGSEPTTPLRRSSYAPPSGAPGTAPREDLHSAEVSDLCHTLLEGMLIGHDHVVGLEDELAPDVVLWTPTCFVATKLAVLDTLLVEDRYSGPLSELVVTTTNTDVAPPRVIVEWRITGRFTESFFVGDDVLIEPTGQLVETAGILAVTFDAAGVVAVRLYHDPFALLEQILAG